MATLEEVYADVLASDEEKKALVEAMRAPEGPGAFFAQRGCDATPEQVDAFLRERAASVGEVDDALLAAIAGGASAYEQPFLDAGLDAEVAAYSIAEVMNRTNRDFGDLTYQQWVMANRKSLACMSVLVPWV